MDNIDKVFYKDSRAICRKCSNEELIMRALYTILDEVNELKGSHPHKDSSIIEALKDELRIRVQKDK